MESLTRSALYEAASGREEVTGQPGESSYLTLCPVGAPVTVPEPKSVSLQRFRFFFTRCQDNGRESYWLNFGYFRTTDEARKWREVLCRVYPAAAIRSVPQAGRASPSQAAPTESQVLTESQVFSLLTRKPPEAPPQSRGPREARKGSSLEDTLSELRDSAWQSLDLNDDTASATGVRHLRVEVQAKARGRMAKASGAARKR